MSRTELALGQQAYEAGDQEAAIEHLRNAAHWYAPASPYVETALDDLRRLGREAEMEGQRDIALAAYRAIRTSCLGTRSLYTPHEDRLEEANGRIAAIMARAERPPMDRGKTVEQLRREHADLLSNVEAPDPGFSLVACVAFLAWIGFAFAFIAKGMDKELRLRKKPAALFGSLTLAMLALWILALLWA